MNKELQEKIARSAATDWCRCFKCDKVIRDNGLKCNKDSLVTCSQWYHAYRGALLALEDDRLKELLNTLEKE